MTSRLRVALRPAVPPVLLALLLPAGLGTPVAFGTTAGSDTPAGFDRPVGFGTAAYAQPAAAPVAPPTPSPSAPAPYYGTGSLAGSGAGEGQQRPGRGEPESVPDPAVWRPLPPPPREVRRPEGTRPPPSVAVPSVPGTADEPRERAAEGPAFPGLRVLPLGAGMVLIGLGLGFLGLRLRRG
ncbi:hypothetical protein [Streptomyces aureocirculatus]|uniref:hypothetical protein n=1 Tax=Streptomyces aureocirculatus TaxID=67275 RepID=UPI00068DE724|nr:hypothetical protein [Streptomyces aureocirculatus]